MKTTRREFLGTTAGFTGLAMLGGTELSGRADAADSAPGRLIQYHGLRPTDPGGRLGLRNPERGWRIETVIAEPSRKTFGPAHHLAGKVSPVYQEDWWMLDAGRFEPFGLTLVQAYCYLTEFAGQPISDEKLTLLQESFDNLRRRGLKAVLRFAYERDTKVKEGPTLDWILRHIDQLQPLLRRNVDVIQDHLGYRLELRSARLPEKVKNGVEFRVDVELVNRGFATLHNPRPVSLALMDRTGKVTEHPVTGADPRQWQPFRPGDTEYKPMVHKITWTGHLPANVQPGWYQIGLWLPDAAGSLRLDPRYAVRAANRDVPWWTDPGGHYGINLLGVIEAVP